jgi:CHASE2 domain-containing sensor protein
VSRRLRAAVAWVGSRFRKHRQEIGVLLALAAVFGLVEKIDPFNIGAASEARSQQVAARIFSPFYRASGDVVVVLIDDEYLRQRQIGWPMRFAEQGRLLRQMASVGPAVIAVDLVYPHRHGDVNSADKDEFRSLLAPLTLTEDPMIRDTTIVFTAMALPAGQGEPLAGFEFCPEESERISAPREIRDPESTPADLMAQVRGDRRFSLGYVRWQGCGDNYPLMLGGRVDAPTPVFATYRAWCASGRALGKCGVDPSRTPERFLAPVLVRYGAFPPAEQRLVNDETQCQAAAPTSSDGRRWLSAFQQLVLGMFTDLRRDPDPRLNLRCPAVTVIPMSRLQESSRDTWEQLLKGKAVVIGADITGIPDLVATPVHGLVPGAVWHGMALDNLISVGDGYLREVHEPINVYEKVALALLLVLVFPLLLRTLGHENIKAWRARSSLALWLVLAITYACFGKWEAAALVLVVAIAFDLTSPTSAVLYMLSALFAAVTAVLFLQHGKSVNWLAAFTVLGAVIHTIKPYYKESHQKHFPDRDSVLLSLLRSNPSQSGE